MRAPAFISAVQPECGLKYRARVAQDLQLASSSVQYECGGNGSLSGEEKKLQRTVSELRLELTHTNRVIS